MRKCTECDVEMRRGSLFGDPFIMDLDHEVDKFYVNVETGKQTKSIFGTTPEVDRVPLLVFVCPKCGKVDLYINPQKLKKEE